ncbi:MAG TPA: IS4 family transposase, partial [Longimicrobium sp.]|nr:IS4 family transposase [Longimicrobium sp.]
IWIAISVYLIVAIVRKRLGIQRDLYTLLQILSLSLFERIPLEQALGSPDFADLKIPAANQLLLFEL